MGTETVESLMTTIQGKFLKGDYPSNLYLAKSRFADNAKEEAVQKLESQNGIDAFKTLLQIRTYDLEEYINQARYQARQSFRITWILSVIGFALIIIAIGLSVIANYLQINALNTTYLAAISGIITEFISSIFFVLYSKTLEQINSFATKLVQSQNVALSLITTYEIQNQDKRSDALSEITKSLIPK
jgi:hypothetical protein